MVGGHPQESSAVIAYLPDNDVLRRVLIALESHIVRHRGQPALLFLQINIGTRGVRDDPDVLLLVDTHPIVVVSIQGTLHMVFLPEHLAIGAIDTHQLTIS